jgi:hypothetical protein
MAKNEMLVIPLPPCSPDLTPCDFFLFPKMKLKLKDIDEIQAESQRVLNTLRVNEFQEEFQKMEETVSTCRRELLRG